MSQALTRGPEGPGLDEIRELLRPMDLPPLAKKPLVSVLVQSYNYASLIGDAIESVLQQTYANFEIVVCDDGSSDNSCEVVESYAKQDHRVRLLRKSNGGVVSSVNAAFLKSKGEIICLLNADDRFLLKKLEAVVDAFHAHPDSGFLTHRIARTDLDGNEFGVLPMLWEPPSGWFGHAVLRTGDCPPGLAPTVGICFRRQVANRILPLPDAFGPGSPSGWDHAVNCLLSLTTRIIGLPDILAEFRLHGANSFNSSALDRHSLHRLLMGHKACWQVQLDYLASIDERLAEAFPPLEQNMGFQVATYLHARFAREHDAFSAYRNLLHSRRFSSCPASVRWFWRLSILLPPPLFRAVANLLWGQGGTPRRLFFRVVRLTRKGKTFDAGWTKSRT